MRKLLFLATVVIFCSCGSSKDKKEDTGKGEKMEARLDRFMKASEDMDFETVLDYSYPKIFDIAPRATLLREMKGAFTNEDVQVEMDSLKIVKIHPVFTLGKGQYAKIDYSMLMLMRIKSKDSTAAASEFIKASIEEKYGKDNVSVSENGAFRIRNKSEMVAIKDELSKEWTFININNEDSEMMDKMLPKDVQDKLATYN